MRYVLLNSLLVLHGWVITFQLTGAFSPLRALTVTTTTSSSSTRHHHHHQRQLLLLKAASTSSAQVLESLLDGAEEEALRDPERESSVRAALVDLASTAQTSNERQALGTAEASKTTIIDGKDFQDSLMATAETQKRFQPMIGNYKVLYTLPNKPNEKPVGGKWNRRNPLLSLQESWQHLAPPTAKTATPTMDGTLSVAQAINVISLQMFFSLLQITVLLRGDAFALSAQDRLQIASERQTPYGGLSNRAVRVNFDPPRIFLTTTRHKNWKNNQQKNNSNKAKVVLLALQLGPPSSVVLDTPYFNDRIRLGKGSRGSLFLFGRTQDPAVQDEWTQLLALKAMTQSRLLTLFGTITASLGGLLAFICRSWLQRVLLAPVFCVSLLFTISVAVSSGGIQRDSDVSALDAKKKQ